MGDIYEILVWNVRGGGGGGKAAVCLLPFRRTENKRPHFSTAQGATGVGNARSARGQAGTAAGESSSPRRQPTLGYQTRAFPSPQRQGGPSPPASDGWRGPAPSRRRRSRSLPALVSRAPLSCRPMTPLRGETPPPHD